MITAEVEQFARLRLIPECVLVISTEIQGVDLEDSKTVVDSVSVDDVDPDRSRKLSDILSPLEPGLAEDGSEGGEETPGEDIVVLVVRGYVSGVVGQDCPAEGMRVSQTGDWVTALRTVDVLGVESHEGRQRGDVRHGSHS